MDERMASVLAEYDARSAQEAQQWRQMGTTMSRDDFLLAVGPATGGLMNTLIKGAGAKHILEIGTSYGYSALWLADAARETGGKVTSLDVAANKQAYAKGMLTKAGLDGHVDFLTGDALQLIPAVLTASSQNWPRARRWWPTTCCTPWNRAPTRWPTGAPCGPGPA